MTEPHRDTIHEEQGFRLRALRACDAPDLLRVTTDPAVMRHVGDGRKLTADKVDLWIARSMANYARHGYGTFALADPADDGLFGWAGFVPPPHEPVPEIIYGFEQARWGGGLGFRVAAALVRLGRDRYRFPTILATVDDDHGRSIRILEQLGFQLDGTERDEAGLVRRYLLHTA